MSKPSSHFARFVSSVKGHLVSRYGTATDKSAPSLIGARRKTTSLGVGPFDLERTTVELEWDEEAIVALTETEARRFAREYDGHVARNELKARTADEFDRFVASHSTPDPDPEAATEPAPPPSGASSDDLDLALAIDGAVDASDR